MRIHPESIRNLRDLCSLHGAPAIGAALMNIAIERKEANALHKSIIDALPRKQSFGSSARQQST